MSRLFRLILLKVGTLGMLGLVCIVTGLCTLPFGIHSAQTNHDFRSTAQSTEGIITNETSAGRSGTIFSFSYTVKNNTYAAQERGRDVNVEGTQQKILYDPANPSHAILADNSVADEEQVLQISIGLLCAGVVLTILGLVWSLLHSAKNSKI